MLRTVRRTRGEKCFLSENGCGCNAKIKHYVDPAKVGKNTRNTWMYNAKCMPNSQKFDLKSMKKASQMVPNTAHGGPKAPHGHPGVPKSAPGMLKSDPKVLQKPPQEAKM